MGRGEEAGSAAGGEALEGEAEGVAEGEGEEGGARHGMGYGMRGGGMQVTMSAQMIRARSDQWAEVRQATGAAVLLTAACAVPVLALAAVFWLIDGSSPAVIVLILGLPIAAFPILLTVLGYARERWVRSTTSIEFDEVNAVIWLRGFRERINGRIVGRVHERAVPACSIRALRRTTHGPNWEATVVWVDENGRERQVLIDEDRMQAGRFSETLAERLGLAVETQND
jgi:hypothetical protein